jgi:hypothetical protein
MDCASLGSGFLGMVIPLDGGGTESFMSVLCWQGLNFPWPVKLQLHVNRVDGAGNSRLVGVIGNYRRQTRLNGLVRIAVEKSSYH